VDRGPAKTPSGAVVDMTGQHLKELFAAFRTQDELAFRRVALAIIEEEGYPHAAAEKLAIDAQRSAVVNDRNAITQADLDDALKNVTAGPWWLHATTPRTCQRCARPSPR
jgi:hypothetical protein